MNNIEVTIVDRRLSVRGMLNNIDESPRQLRTLLCLFLSNTFPTNPTNNICGYVNDNILINLNSIIFSSPWYVVRLTFGSCRD